MREIQLPYPLNVGKVSAGDWASTVPDRLVFEGRVGVPVRMTGDEVRALVERCIDSAADNRGEPPTVEWSGGQFEPSETPPDHPLVQALIDEVTAATGVRPRVTGATYGADMRLYRGYGIPTVMCGPGELHEAHAPDESVAIDDVVRHATVLASLAAQFGA
jgi:acetylornithine deacetylase